MVKKDKWFFDGKKFWFFKIIRLKISKILKFSGLRDFFNFLQALTFDIFMLANRNFLHIFYTGNIAEK